MIFFIDKQYDNGLTLNVGVHYNKFRSCINSPTVRLPHLCPTSTKWTFSTRYQLIFQLLSQTLSLMRHL
jgi:hypothetical protein